MSYEPYKAPQLRAQRDLALAQGGLGGEAIQQALQARVGLPPATMPACGACGAARNELHNEFCTEMGANRELLLLED